MKSLKHKLFIDTLLARLLFALFVLAGVLSYNSMIRENFPDLEIPQAIVSVYWPGAAPEQIEKEIVKPLEDEIRTVKGIKSFSSGSYNSYAMVAVEFDADMPVAEAMQYLRANVNQAESEFPMNVGVEKPNIEEMSVSDMPVITWALYGDVDDLVLTDVAKQLEDRIEGVPSVKKVELGGLREKSLHIQLQPDKLREFGISPLLVQSRIQAANADIAWGEFEGGDSMFTLYLAGRFDSEEKVRKLPITRLGDNRPVRLEELADVSLRLDREKSQTFFSMDNKEFIRAITLDVSKRPGEDTFAVIAATEKLVEEIVTSNNWPQGLHLKPITDDGELIEIAFNDVESSMYMAVLIVALVLMFLLTWREAIIASLALPVTLLASLAILSMIGYTLNAMIMIGMVLALGLMVDVFILVMEGMHEGLYVKHLSFNKAALNTVKSFFLPATAGQLTTILALVPMMLIGGIDGKFIRILPVTMTVCLLVSLVVAFLLCIPLSRYLLEKESGKQHELIIDRISSRYRTGLSQWLLANPLKNKKRAAAWVGGAFGLFILSLVAASQLPVLMYPDSDDRKLGVSLELGPNATLEEARQVADKAGEFLRQQPWVEKVISYVGEKTPVAMANLNEALLPSQVYNQVGFTVILVPKDDRDLLSYDYLPKIRNGIEAALHDEVGYELYLTHLGGDPESAAPIQIEIIGNEYSELMDIAAQVRERLQTIPGADSVRDNLGAPVREIRFTYKSEQLSFHGVSEQTVAAQIRMAMEEDEFGRFKVEGIQEDPKIRISQSWASRGDELGSPMHLAEMQLLRIIADDGRIIPLMDLVNFEIIEIPRVFVHSEGRRAVKVMAQPLGRTATEIVMDILPWLESQRIDWPQGYDYELGGELKVADDSYGNMGNAFMLAILMIFILLALMFHSLGQPVIILLVVPLALTGTFIGYFLAGIPMSFTGLIGVVSLAGIAVNNGIVLVETMNQHRGNGESVIDAAAYGAADRLRPIVSTSLTTILGLMPLAFSDPGWYPLCMAIVFGLLAATVFAMVVVPALYLLLTPESSPVMVD